MQGFVLDEVRKRSPLILDNKQVQYSGQLRHFLPVMREICSVQLPCFEAKKCVRAHDLGLDNRNDLNPSKTYQ